jgi:hypothetical protein
MLHRAFVALLLATAVSMGCGGGTSPPPPSTSTPTGRAGMLRLGHYSSGDGMVGFVLDRTGPQPKVRIDGTTEVLPLEIRRTSHTSADLVNHEKNIGISVDDDGSVVFSRRGAGPNKEMYRDGDASPL